MDLVKHAAEVWLEVGQQRCRVYLVMSRISKEPLRGRHIALGSSGALELIVKPEVRRVGNTQGEQLENDELVTDCKGSFVMFRPELR